MGVTNKQLLNELKRITALLSQLQIGAGVSGAGFHSVNLQPLVALLETIDADTSLMEPDINTINNSLLTIKTDIDNIKSNVQVVNSNTDSNPLMDTKLGDLVTDLAAIEVLLTGIDTLLTAIDDDTNNMRANLAIINSNTDPLPDTILTELESIDQNWNLLSVNSVAMVATAANTLGNATEDKQDTMITSLATNLTDNDQMISWLVLIEAATDGLEGKLDTIITHVDGIEGELNSIKAHLDKIEDQQYETPNIDVDVLTMVTGDLTQTQSITAGQLNEIIALTLVGETTANRTVTISIVVNSVVVGLADIVVNSGTTMILDDTKFDRIRQVLLNLKLHSLCELRCVASAVTATESVICNIAMVKRNS